MTLMKVSKEDKVFSDLVRLRAGWICESCGKDCSHQTGLLHCSHWQKRANRSTRWHPLNAFAHCHVCHPKFENNPLMFDKWVAERLGQELADEIDALSKRPSKLKPWDIEEIHKHMLKERARLLQNIGGIAPFHFTVPSFYYAIGEDVID